MPERTRLLNLLAQYGRKYPGEAPMVKRYTDFVTRHKDCFQRSLLEGHVTGSAWLLDAAAQRVLLTHHRKLDRWLQPGGHADGDSDVSRVAMKEAMEESGLASISFVTPDIFDIDIHKIPARKNEPDHLHYDCRFLLKSTGPDTLAISPESHNLAWVPFPELPKYTKEKSIQRMHRKCQKLLSAN